MSNATWESTISSTIYLATSPPSRASFGTVLFIVDQDDGNSLNGARTMSFANYGEAETAEAAGYISADTLEAMRVAFSQLPTPAEVKLGYHDSGGAETLAAAITAIRAADDDWYGLCLYSRADADIVAVANAIEAAAAKFFVGQSDDASWKNAGLPAGLSTLAGKERTAMIFHDADAEYADLAWAVSRLVFDPDVKSAGWEGQIREVAELTTALTSAERDAIEDNYANVGLPFSSADVYVSPGINCNNRPIYEIVSTDWFKTRCHEDLAYMKLQHTARGEKLTVDRASAWRSSRSACCRARTRSTSGSTRPG
jgi:hypothetical protein